MARYAPDANSTVTPSGMKRSLSPPPGAGRRVGRYRVLTELGRGGMATVYLVVAHGPGGVNKLVVLKALLPELASEPESLTMFLDEARLAAQLNHPNVVQTYEVGTEGDRHVIVMEYLEGQSLSAIIKRAELKGEPLPAKLHLRVVVSALEGLHYAHGLCAYDGTPLELVHRDISPQNVFVTYDGQVKVLDFGIAKAASSSTQTATGVIKGKLAYMAPEQVAGDLVDRRADLFSIGCMLWAAATGKKLWKDVPDVQIMRSVMRGDMPTPQSHNPTCDDELNHIVMKALAWKPEERYQTALELEQDLEAYAERYSAQAKQKDLAQYVSSLFADTRAEVRALVERRLSLTTTEESSSGAATMVVSQTDEDLPEFEDEPSQSWQPTTSGAAMRAKQRWNWPLILAAGAAAVVGGVHLLATRVPVHPAEAALQRGTIEQPAAATASPAMTMPASPTATAATGEFTSPPITSANVEAAPSAATKDASSHKRQKVAPSRVVRLPPAVAATSVRQPDKKAACEEPFYLAPDGTRRLRPECE
jgi:serine/threonine protein kinase